MSKMKKKSPEQRRKEKLIRKINRARRELSNTGFSMEDASRARVLKAQIFTWEEQAGVISVKTQRADFYRSDDWRQIRYQALKRYGRECVCCGAKPGNGIVLHVDHIKPRSKHPELELDLDNLQILCADCNLGKGNTDSIDYRNQ